MPFVHLRTHTEFSVVDGTLRIDDVVDAAAADRQPALALTDLNNLFGAVKFYSAARKAGVKPVIGADVLVEPEGGYKHPSRLLLLIQNIDGYNNLSELLALGWTQGVQRAQASIRWEWLERYNKGLIALSGYLPLVGNLAAERHPANFATPIFMAHGTADPVVVLPRAEESRKALEALGYAVQWHTYPMPHSVHPREIADISAFLRQVLPAA